VSAPVSDQAQSAPPGRFLARIAGVLTQLAGAGSLLLGTVALVLVKQQGDPVATPFVIGWLVAAMVTLIVGGLAFRGGVISLLLGGTLVAGCGATLILIQRGFGRLLPLNAEDASTAAAIVLGIAGGMLATALLCLLAIPQARRYARWLDAGEVVDSPASTMRGFAPATTPPHAAVKTAMIRLPRESRRRMWFVIAGAIVGVVGGLMVAASLPSASRAGGAGSAGAREHAATTGEHVATTGEHVATTGDHTGTAPAEHPTGASDGGSAADGGAVMDGDAATATTTDAATATTTTDAATATTTDAAPTPTPAARPALKNVAALVDELHRRLARGEALDDLLLPTAAGFGLDADELALDRGALLAAIHRDLGVAPPAGFTLGHSAVLQGSQGAHAWLAEILDVSGPGLPTRRLSLALVAADVSGSWTIAAWHLAAPVTDARADRLAAAGKLPSPTAIKSHRDGPIDLDAAVRAAFGSRRAFVDAFSARGDAFNIGSGPGERIRGGAAIKKVFGRLRAEVGLHDGAVVVAASGELAWSLLNVDFELDGRATQTFRVLAVLVHGTGGWELVATQWSNGGPLP
jgi:hypothetical protein